MDTTGADFHEDHRLADGTRVTLRHIRPGDADELRRGFRRLSSGSRRRRFLAPRTDLTDAEVRYFTCVDGRDHVAIVATTPGPDPPGERGLGVARFVRLQGDPEAAEVAITVADDAQGKGLGRLLALTLARAALERGVRRFRGELLAGNEAVRRLLEEAGATLHGVTGALTFEIALDPAVPDPGARRDLVARRLLRAAATRRSA